jgi:hypothetical protein
MLLRNYAANNANPGREVGSAYTNPYQWMKGATLMNWFIGQQWDVNYTKKNSLPTGTEAPYAFRMAIEGGELSSTTGIKSAATVTAGIASGINLEADLAGSGELQNSLLSLITSLQATLAGSSTVTASMVGIVALAADLAGSGDIEGALGIIANLSAELAGIGEIEGIMKGIANLQANIYVNSGAATTQEIAAAVWDEPLNDHLTAGTTGKKQKDNLTQNNFIGLK